MKQAKSHYIHKLRNRFVRSSMADQTPTFTWCGKYTRKEMSGANWLKAYEMDLKSLRGLDGRVSPAVYLEYFELLLVEEAAEWGESSPEANRLFSTPEPTQTTVEQLTSLFKQRMKIVSSDFRQVVSDKMKDPQRINHVNEMPFDEKDPKQLKLGGALNPRLLGQDSRLVYHWEERSDRINKNQYKSSLASVSTNLKKVVDAEKVMSACIVVLLVPTQRIIGYLGLFPLDMLFGQSQQVTSVSATLLALRSSSIG